MTKGAPKRACSTYQQLTHRLRFPMGPGRPDVVSERPMDSKRRFLDGPEGTTVEIPEGALVDVEFLLKIGAIEAISDQPSAISGPADSRQPTADSAKRSGAHG